MQGGENMFDVVALGELLIDFTPVGHTPAGSPVFEANPGGAPANVLAAVSKLGGKSAFIGKVGDDQFGHFLEEVLKSHGIDTAGLSFSDSVNTTLAFVHLDQKGERSFSFYRNPGADIMLDVQDIKPEIIADTRIFHFGSLSLTHEPARSATLHALNLAKKKNKVISFDPNWRPPLWKDDAAAREGMFLGLQSADILKLSEEEMEFLTGEQDLEKGSGKLFDMGIKLVLVTMGEKGCFYRCSSGTGSVKAYDVRVLDTTGAGDAFMGALLYGICKRGILLDEINVQELEGILDFASAAGGLCTTKRGGIPAMPTLEEVRLCVKNIKKL